MAGYKFTKKELKREILKCGKDPIYFINNYCKIAHPIQGLIPFKTYDFQDDILEAYNDHRFNITLKARQLGITTITCAYTLWMMLFHRNKEILVVATKLKTSSKLIGKVKDMYKHLPDWLKISKSEIDNSACYKLENGSIFTAASTSSDSGRSDSLSLLIIDEAAHVDGLDEMWAAIKPTITTGGRCIIISTPNGTGQFFHKTYTEAEEEKNDFNYVKLMWWVHPDRDQEWFDNETRNMSKRQIAQEYECNFNASGETVFHSDDLTRIEEEIIKPKYKTGFDRNFWIWEEYKSECSYLIAADVARGDGKDYSVFHIIKLDTMEIIGEYQGKVTPDVFSQLLNNVGNEYGQPMMVVENNSVGFAVLEKLIEFEYPSIYYSVKSTHEYVDQYEAEQRTGTIAGFTTSSKTRPLIVAKLEEFIRNKIITIYSKRLLNEMKTFIWKDGKAEAQRTYNDDLIMSLAIGCWVRDTALNVNKRELEYSKSFLNSMFVSKKSIEINVPGMLPDSVINGEPREELTEVQKREKRKSLLDSDTKQRMRDYSWLYKG